MSVQLPKYVIISGNIGSGKTTLFNVLKDKLKGECHFIPEYIDGDAKRGQTMLNDYLKGNLSAYDFQDYILDYYKSALAMMDNCYHPSIIERSPIEGIEVFAKNDVMNGRLTEEEYNELHEKAEEIITPRSLCYSEIRHPFDPNKEADGVIDLMRKCHAECVWIKLYATPQRCMKNIATRNRTGESCYDLAYLERLHSLYEKFWNRQLYDSSDSD